MKWQDWIKLYEDPKELTRRRELLGLTQAQLAHRAGVGSTWLVMIEKGKINITAEKIKTSTQEKLARVWQVLDSVRKEREKQLGQLGTLADLRAPKDTRELARWDNLTNPNFLTNQNRQLKEEIRRLHEVLAAQKELLSEAMACWQDLIKETESKDTRIAELEKKVSDLQELYEVGTAAVVATARYEELREKVKK
jgi:transcriptional regulator with XRE-family HTH domain